jgi:acyl transferase domain-containing protein/ubiquinone/menaquinone biosynthesis C-methylase UbiE
MVPLFSHISVSRSKKLICADELLNDEKASKVNLGTMSQSMCSALQLALVDLLQSWGLQPDEVVGHSSGEIAAAYAIGALSSENCLKIAYYRGIASDELTKNHPNLKGGMIAVGASAEHVSTLLEIVTEGKVAIACFNGPSSITVSGDNAGIQQLHHMLMESGIFSRRLRVAHAYHSHHMGLVESTYRKLLGPIHTTNDFKGEMWSSVTAERIDPKTLNDEYWVNNLLAPVRFSQSLGRLLETCTSDSISLIEVGPHSALRGPVEDLLAVFHKNHQTLYSSTLLRLQSATQTMLELAGKLFCQGHKVKISAVNLRHKATSEDVLTNLPPYVWNHSQRFFHETRYAQDYLNRAESRSDFLGAPSPDSSSLEPRWRHVLSISEVPWVQDHVIQSQIIYPAAGYVSMAIEGSVRIAAARQISLSVHIIREMSIIKALVVPEKGKAIETAISFRPYNESHRTWSEVWNEFRISSWTSESGWTEHCRGLVSSQIENKHNEVDGSAALHQQEETHAEAWRHAKEGCTELVDVDQFYRQLYAIGMEFGSSFKCLTSARTGEHTAVGQITPTDTASKMPSGFESPHILHPATLDSMFQTVLVALHGQVRLISRPLVPTFIKELIISGTPRRNPQQGWICRTVASSKSPRDVVASVTAHETSESGLKIEVKGLRGVLLEPESTGSQDNTSHNRICTTLWDTDVEISPGASFEQNYGDSARNKAHNIDQTMALEAAALAYMVEALRKTDEKDVSPQSGHLLKLYLWMKQQEDKRLAASSPKLDRHPHEAPALLGEEGLPLDRIGSNLDKILRGQVQPLALITKDNLLERYHSNKSVLSDANTNAANYVKRLSHKNPNMNILEVGAGTGSTTFPILQALGGLHDGPPRFTRYTFTDISTTFIEQARVRFSRGGKLVEFGKLNIEISPYMQGFTPGSYDLIIAANVLHATSELKRTLKNVRSLLKPGGKLLLVEMTKDMLHLHLVWGTLPGWWYGELSLLKKI